MEGIVGLVGGLGTHLEVLVGNITAAVSRKLCYGSS